MDYSWFEMRDVRKRHLDAAVWIPLRASQVLSSVGTLGFEGFHEEYFGAGSIAVPLADKAAAEVLGWSDVGISSSHRPSVENGKYIPTDVYESHRGDLLGISLVLEQDGNGAELKEWHLLQDFVIALELKREGDSWVAINEAYVEVARLRRAPDGSPILLEVRAEHLKDYLRAREMALYVNSYRSRVNVVLGDSIVAWKDAPPKEESKLDRWEGRAWDIHEGSWMHYGAETAVFRSGRVDIDPKEDVPTLGAFDNGEFKSESWTAKQKGSRLTRIEGEMWRSEWVEPAPKSPRVRRDKVPSTVSFVVDAAGTRELPATLKQARRWLWFQPELVMALAHRRGGGLSWFTRHTGAVSCTPRGGVHFGMNNLGLVTVYAKDVAVLPEWQQRIWAGFNVSPDRGVSEELQDSQVRAEPAATVAPETLLPQALEFLEAIGSQKFGFSFISKHKSVSEILPTIHRFRAIDRAGLFALAKDVARVIVDNIDAAALQKIVPPPKNTQWRSLKSLESVVALQLGSEKARAALGPIVGAYELRHADAHLPGSDIDAHLKLVNVDQLVPFVVQGFQLLTSVVRALGIVAKALQDLPSETVNASNAAP